MIALIALSTEGTGPRTIEPTPSSWSLSVAAIRYSSSTTRMRRSRSAELAILVLLRLRSGERKRDRAVDAVRLDRESCPGSELIGQSLLDETPAVAGPRPPIRGSACVNAAFLPADRDPGRRRLRLSPRASECADRPSSWPIAPYFTALVVSSCKAIANAWTVLDSKTTPLGPSSVTVPPSSDWAESSDSRRLSNVTPSPGGGARQQSLHARKRHEAIASGSP